MGIKPIKIKDIEKIKSDLSKLDFIKIQDHGLNSCLILILDSTFLQRFFLSDWILQLQMDKITKDWFALDLDNILNLDDINKMHTIIKILEDNQDAQIIDKDDK